MMKLIELLSNTKPNSTVLQPFYWVMLILLGLIYIFNSNKTDRWILLILIAAFLIVVIAFIVAYFIRLNKNPDNLRSESYNMSKLEIESGIKKQPRKTAATNLNPMGAVSFLWNSVEQKDLVDSGTAFYASFIDLFQIKMTLNIFHQKISRFA